MSQRRRTFAAARLAAGGAAALILALAKAAWAAPPSAAPTASNAADASSLLTEIVRAALPADYEDTRRWGGTKEIVTGLRVRRDGWRIHTNRRKKEVNHGTWKRYRIRLVEPDERLRVRLENLEQLPDGRAAVDLLVAARLALFGRISEWRRGVQLFSFSADAEADVTLRVRFALAISLDPSHAPPDLLLDPEALQADVHLDRFQLIRISDAHGPLVRWLGGELEDLLQKKLDEKRTDLVQRINRELARRPDALRLSAHDALLRQWRRWTKQEDEPQAGSGSS